MDLGKTEHALIDFVGRCSRAKSSGLESRGRTPLIQIEGALHIFLYCFR